MQSRAIKLLAYAAIAVLVLAAAIWFGVRAMLSSDRIKGAIESQASAAIGRPVTIATATPHLFPRVGLDLTGIAIGAGREVTIEHVTLTTGLGGLLRRRVEDARIRLVRSRIDVRWALDLLAAFSAAPAAPASQASPTAAFTVDSIGALELRDVVLAAGSRVLRVDLDSSLHGGDRLDVTRLHGVSDGSNLNASGALTSIAKRTGTFTIDAETLDLDGLMAFLAASTPAGSAKLNGTTPTPAPAADTQPLHFDIQIAARKGQALGVALTNLKATCQVRGNDVLLDGLKVDLFGGRYAGEAAFKGSGAEPIYQWRGSFEGLDIPQLMTFAGASGVMTGRLAGSMALSAEGADPQAAIQHARGSAKVVATDGRIPGLEIVRGVILAFGKPTGEIPAGSGEAFSRLSATLGVNGPSLAVSDLAFASRDLDMSGQGTMSLTTRAIDFRTDVMLSRELSAQAGRDLYRLAREGERIVLPARITGTVSSPNVFVDIQAALGRALRNKAQDALKSLFDKWRK